jgi:NADPH:quinone reductase-like Zn-dependent oxidoreductase
LIPKKTIILLMMLMGFCAFALVHPAASNCAKVCGTSDPYGYSQNTFSPGDDVYISGSEFCHCGSFCAYVVDDTTWSNGMKIPSAVASTAVPSDASGNILPTMVWQGATYGKYDIIIDVDGNGYYDEGVDCLVDNAVQVTAGFFVVPEYIIGTLLGLAGCFAAYGVFRLSKRREK